MYDLAEMNDPAFLSRVSGLFQPEFMARMDVVGDAVGSFADKPSRAGLLRMLGCDEQTFVAFLAVLEARKPGTGKAAREAMGMPPGPAAILHTDIETGAVEVAFTCQHGTFRVAWTFSA